MKSNAWYTSKVSASHESIPTGLRGGFFFLTARTKVGNIGVDTVVRYPFGNHEPSPIFLFGFNFKVVQRSCSFIS